MNNNNNNSCNCIERGIMLSTLKSFYDVIYNMYYRSKEECISHIRVFYNDYDDRADEILFYGSPYELFNKRDDLTELYVRYSDIKVWNKYDVENGKYTDRELWVVVQQCCLAN